MTNEKKKGDGSSCVPVRSRKVFEPLELRGYVRGELLHVLGRQHAVASKMMNLKLYLLVSANPEPGGQFIDVREVPLHEHLHERHEVRVVKCCCSFCNKPKHSLEVQDSKLEVFGRQLPTVGGPRSHLIGGDIVCSEVRTRSRPLETPLLSEEEIKELLGIGGGLFDGLVLI